MTWLCQCGNGSLGTEPPPDDCPMCGFRLRQHYEEWGCHGGWQTEEATMVSEARDCAVCGDEFVAMGVWDGDGWSLPRTFVSDDEECEACKELEPYTVTMIVGMSKGLVGSALWDEAGRLLKDHFENNDVQVRDFYVR